MLFWYPTIIPLYGQMPNKSPIEYQHLLFNSSIFVNGYVALVNIKGEISHGTDTSCISNLSAGFRSV